MKAKYCLATALLAAACHAGAAGWPASYEGVMLQGFYWDSFTDTRWTNLESQADELSQYFSLIWVPQSAKAASNPGMGYDPVYWFSNYTSSFGNETQLRSMINTFKDKGTGIIADVVVNHRSGVSNWTNFPKETWNGKTYQLGPEHICSTDEVRNAAGQATPTGAPDTGEDFDGSRDLDHTNATVQDHIKDYTRFLLTDLGYSGFRYDMVKGFGGQYVGIYNRSSQPTYSVGEYWDGNYDAVAAWIEATGRQSAAFDFPFKYAVNEAFASGDMTKLVWKANGTTDQPAGMIHFGYAQYSVTFIDNHDTYRDDWNKFNGNVVAANAFMLCSPGTPCVFLPHWKANKAAIKALIDIRNAVGVTNTSAVKVLRSSRDCYMAEVTGTKGRLVVKIGSAQVSPEGYSNSDIKASGNDYCVWSKQGGGSSGGDTPVGEAFTVYFNNSSSNWTTPHIHYWGDSESTWPGVAMSRVEGQIWSYKVPAGTTGLLFNAGDGDASKTPDFVAAAGHIYTTAGDQGLYEGGQGGGDDVKMPSALYVVGNLDSESFEWNPAQGVSMTRSGNCFTADEVEFVAPEGSTDGLAYFSFTTALDSDWDVVNSSDRYGAAEADASVNIGTSVSFMAYPANVSASGALSWSIPQGCYRLTADFSTMKLTAVNATSGVEYINSDNGMTEYYNLQGVRVAAPEKGVYIEVRNGKARKIRF